MDGDLEKVNNLLTKLDKIPSVGQDGMSSFNLVNLLKLERGRSEKLGILGCVVPDSCAYTRYGGV